MIYIILDEKIKDFESDIRDLVMAFFPYEEYLFLDKDMEKYDVNDIVVKDFYKGEIYEDRYLYKTNIKRDLYLYLKNILKKDLSWGILTGIRPVNIITEGIPHHQFNESDDIKNYLKNEYFLSDNKIDELIEISKVEKEVLSRKEVVDYKNRCSVYIGVPFCRTTCLYCSFTSYSIDKCKGKVKSYISALDKEIEYNIENEKMDDVKNPLSIYIGGGTPTSLSEEDFYDFLKVVDKNFNTKNHNSFLEYTVEAGRPDTITEKKLYLMKEFGVNRISINPQTFNQKTLDLIGRKHTVEDVIDKYNLAREIGFDNINMDIILGLPNETLEDVYNTLDNIKKLAPDDFTVHSLALKRAARLNYEKDIWIDSLKNDNIEEMFLASKNCAIDLNLRPYYLYRQKNMKNNLENVGYSSKNKECIYNIMMMGEKHTVYGFGCGGVGKRVEYKDKEKIVTRMKGTKSLDDYIKTCEELI